MTLSWDTHMVFAELVRSWSVISVTVLDGHGGGSGWQGGAGASERCIPAPRLPFPVLAAWLGHESGHQRMVLSWCLLWLGRISMTLLASELFG